MTEQSPITFGYDTPDGDLIEFTLPCHKCGMAIRVADGGHTVPHTCGDLILRDVATERGTRYYWSGRSGAKPYHWAVSVRTGRLTLLPGPDPRALAGLRN